MKTCRVCGEEAEVLINDPKYGLGCKLCIADCYDSKEEAEFRKMSWSKSHNDDDDEDSARPT